MPYLLADTPARKFISLQVDTNNVSYTRKGTACRIGVNLSSNAYPTGILPLPL
jgi:hypothetical protein